MHRCRIIFNILTGFAGASHNKKINTCIEKLFSWVEKEFLDRKGRSFFRAVLLGDEKNGRLKEKQREVIPWYWSKGGITFVLSLLELCKADFLKKF